MVFDETAFRDEEIAEFDALPAPERLFAILDAYEVRLVARTAAACDRAGARRIAEAATFLGNGWLYPIVAALAVLARIDHPGRFLVSSLASFGAAFAIYPFLKTFLARKRPCAYDASLVRRVAPLDTYSCPSGHAMTAAAYSLPLVFAAPGAFAPACAMVAIIGWSRVALGHHYLSDVLVGVILGVAVAAPITLMMF